MKDSRNKYDIRDFKTKYDTVVNSQKSKKEEDLIACPSLRPISQELSNTGGFGMIMSQAPPAQNNLENS